MGALCVQAAWGPHVPSRFRKRQTDLRAFLALRKGSTAFPQDSLTSVRVLLALRKCCNARAPVTAQVSRLAQSILSQQAEHVTFFSPCA